MVNYYNPDWRWENSSTQAKRPCLHISLPGTLSSRAESQNLSSHERASKITFLRKKSEIMFLCDSKQLTLLYLTTYVQIKKAVNSAGSYMCHTWVTAIPRNPTPRKAFHDILHLLVVHNKDTIILGWLSCDWMLAGHFPFIVAERIKEKMNYVGYFYNHKHFSNSLQQNTYIRTLTLKSLSKHSSLGLLRGAAGECGAQVQHREVWDLRVVSSVFHKHSAADQASYHRILYFSDEPQTERMSICLL